MNNKRVKRIFIEHWKAFTFFALASIIAFIGAIYVLIWVVKTSEFGLQGTATLNQWSVSWAVGFLLTLIGWELLFVGLPAGLILGLTGYYWWKHLTPAQMKDFGRDEKKSGMNNGGMRVIFFVSYIIYIYVQGNYYTPFGDLPYSYWVFSGIWTLVWMSIIIGIPGLIAAIVWFKRIK